MTHAHTPAQRAAETIAELQQIHDGTTTIKDPLILIRALTRKASRHGGSIPELMPVEMPLKINDRKTVVSICAAHYKATKTEGEAFAVVVHDLGSGEYNLISSDNPAWAEVPWLNELMTKVMKETRDLELHRIPRQVSNARH